MYRPPQFRVEDRSEIHQMMRATRLCNLVTSGPGGLHATALPLLLEDREGEFGTLYGHLSRANPQWKMDVQGDALAIFMGPSAYVTPAWYGAKQETGKVVPTWNYTAVHAYGVVEFFTEREAMLQLVSQLTERHEADRENPWAVRDAPEDFVEAKLKGIVGLRLEITRLEGKVKASQDKSDSDRQRIAEGLRESGDAENQALAEWIP